MQPPMRNPWMLALVFLVGCSPWNVTRKGDPNPLEGKTTVGLQELEWSGVWVDGVPEAAFLSSNGDWQRDWPGNKSTGSAAFRKAVTETLEGGPLKLLTAPDPSGNSPTIKPSILEVGTGGWNPSKVKISLQVIDAKGKILEEVTTETKGKGGTFESRLGEAAARAGENLAQYLKDRAN